MLDLTVAELKARLAAADGEELAALKRSLAAETRKGVLSAVASAEKRIAAQQAEQQRLQGLFDFQNQLAQEAGAQVVAGLDEVGRGPVAGPLAVAAVVLPQKADLPGLNDSKQVVEPVRRQLAQRIKEVALGWTVQFIPPEFIDSHGMTFSLKTAFSQALAALEAQGLAVDLALLDGNPLHFDRREKNVVKGDAKCASIAAASIVAKVERDELMRALDEQFPGYHLASNKGYGSAEHIEAIRQLGLSPVHRVSFCQGFLQESLF